MLPEKNELAASIIRAWGGDLIAARDHGIIKEFVMHYYYPNSFFKPTLAAFVKNDQDMINYFEGFSRDLIGFAKPEQGRENPHVVQSDWIDETNPKLVAKGTYNFLFKDPASAEHKIIVRADFSFIFSDVKFIPDFKKPDKNFLTPWIPARIFLQHSSLQVKERIKTSL